MVCDHVRIPDEAVSLKLRLERELHFGSMINFHFGSACVTVVEPDSAKFNYLYNEMEVTVVVWVLDNSLGFGGGGRSCGDEDVGK